MLRLSSTTLVSLVIVMGAASACNQIFGLDSGETMTADPATGTGGTGGSPHVSTTTTMASNIVTATTGATTTTTSTASTTTTTTTSTTMTGTGPASVLLASAIGPSTVPDGSAPFETDTVKIGRITSTNKIVLAQKPDGTGTLYVDDNIHVVVTPEGGTAADQYYEFWAGYPCPSASIDIPPGGSASGQSPSIDISFLFSKDTSKAQEVKLEFWHCANHVPAPHSTFYLVQL
jgi:hypothetical protein